MKKQKLCAAICSVLVCIGTLSASAQNTAYGWYCKRNNEHRQPLMDRELLWIENYHGYYVDHTHDDQSEEKVVYLTFDAGYENGNVAKILDVLQAEKVQGTFFVLSHLIEKDTELVKRMVDEGHLVANHTASHKDITRFESKEALQAELSALEGLYQEKTGRDMPKYFRPPEGKFSKQSMAWLSELGYQTIFWSIAYADWDNAKQPSPAYAKAKILDHLHNGAIILLHPTSATNVAILGDVIAACRAQGYRFGSLDELVG